MTRLELIQRVRTITRDLSNSIFREQDITAFINEGIDRFVQYVPELSGMTYLYENIDVPKYLPTQYHHMLAVYSASRCFSQDERHYQATNMMNEFETKLEELKANIDGGNVVILDPTTGTAVAVEYATDQVDLEPYWGIEYAIDDDEY